MDMIFVVQQFIEKCLEHGTKGFLIFVDLRKAYDSVPRPALWAVLRKLGVPDVIVRLVESFHADMVADIIVDGSSVDGIPMCNGLRQGCTMAPVLFNLFAAAVMERWHDRLQVLGVAGFPFKYRAGGQLFKRSVRGTESSISDGEFADDAVLLAETHASTAMQAFVDVAAAFSLTVNTIKTVFMAVGCGIDNADRLPLQVRGNTIAHVNQFRYLGSMATPDGRCRADVSARLAAASQAVGSLHDAVFLNADLLPVTKQRASPVACCLFCCTAQNAGHCSRKIFVVWRPFTTAVCV